MQKKVTNAKRKNKKAPLKGASKKMHKNGQGIFNYDLEIPEKNQKMKKIKKNPKYNSDDVIIGVKEIPKVKKKKVHKKPNQEDIFIGAKEVPKVKKKKIHKKTNQEDIFIGTKETPKVSTKKIKKSQNQDDIIIGVTETPKISKRKLNKIKRKKRKEKIKRNKQIRKQEIKAEKELQKQRKRLNTKQIEKIKKIKKVSLVISIIILILISITLFLLSPIFKITKIEVKGNDKISVDEIISLSGIEKESNLFRTTKSSITKNIRQNAYIEDVKVSRKMPGTVEINVTERCTEYLIEFGSSYAYVDGNGYILEISTELIEGKQKIRGYKTTEEELKPGNRLCKEDINSMYDILTILNAADNYSIKNTITAIDISDDSNYILYLENEKKTVHLGSIDNLDIKMLYLQSIIERDKDKEGLVFLNVDYKEKNPYGRYN